MNCKNCGQNLEGKFCKNCGQSSKVRKINFRYLLDEIPDSIFQLNRGFLFTLKELFTRPGHSIREFLEGKRKNHFKPLAFLLLTATLYVLFNYFLGNQTFIDDLITGFDDASESINRTAPNWIAKNQTYIILLLIPFFSLASYVAFWKSKYNYFEHFILNTYITGQQMLVYLVFSFILDRNSYLTLLPLTLGVLFNFWTYIQFFNSKSTLKKILLVLLTYIIFIIQLNIVILIIALIFSFKN